MNIVTSISQILDLKPGNILVYQVSGMKQLRDILMEIVVDDRSWGVFHDEHSVYYSSVDIHSHYIQSNHEQEISVGTSSTNRVSQRVIDKDIYFIMRFKNLTDFLTNIPFWISFTHRSAIEAIVSETKRLGFSVSEL